MSDAVSVRFPHLGINIYNLAKSFKVFGMEITVDAIVALVAIIAGFLILIYEVKLTWQDMDAYINMSICAMLTAVIGARLYYVIFNWGYYRGNLLQVFHLGNGGLSVYGGAVAAVITCIVFSGIKKIALLRIADTVCMGIVLWKAVDVWGSFFNREVFGKYTDSLFAMQIKYDETAGIMNQDILNHLTRYGGAIYIQVHPIFLYESLWCLMLFALIMAFRRYKKFEGEVFMWCVAGYSLGRAWIDMMRADKLPAHGLNMPLSVVLALICAIVPTCICVIKRIILKKSE